MSNFALRLLIVLIISGGLFSIPAQVKQLFGSLEVVGRVKIDGKAEKLERKRFYLIRGGLEKNKELVERLKKAETTSRDCYYSKQKASPEFICWLKEKNCESPYCREITETDMEHVPEFKAAYQKGLRQFGKRADIALNWLTTNLTPVLSSGFYFGQKSLLKTILDDVRPVRSSMTDSVSVSALFLDIPLELTEAEVAAKKSEKFLVSNLLPLEIGNKSFIWICDIGVGAGESPTVKLDKCDVIVKDLPICNTAGCKK